MGDEGGRGNEGGRGDEGGRGGGVSGGFGLLSSLTAPSGSKMDLQV